MIMVCSSLSLNVFSDEIDRLAPGDVLKIEVTGEEDLTGSYTVSEKGSLHRAWLPEIVVTGMTVEEARQAFEKILAQYLKKPNVKIELDAQKSRPKNLTVFVTGAVNHMGSFNYREGYTALDAIIEAGGFTKFAAPNRAKVVRGQGKDEKIIRVELGDVVNHGDKTKNVTLKPGDILVIPESIL